MSAVLAGVVFATSILLILLKPRRVPDWAAALGGGLLMLLLGDLSPTSAGASLLANWNIFLFFLGLGLAASTADQAGVFSWAAHLALGWSHGSQPRLLLGLYLLGVAVTAVMSNDATALLLTPVVFAVATRAGIDPRPYAFACALVANAASFILPVSNPANLLILQSAPLSLGAFVSALLLPAAAGLLVTLVGLLVLFRGELSVPFEVPQAADKVEPRRRRVAVGILALAAAYVAASALDWPLGLVSLIGALGLLLLNGTKNVPEVAREIPWAIFPLFAGLLLLVSGAEGAGLSGPLHSALEAAAAQPAVGAPLLSLGLALLANIINNLPAALVTATALDPTHAHLAPAAIVGLNLGPNLTTIGSLATMVWLLLLRRRGLDVSPLDYLRVGGVITVPALLAATLGVWIGLR